MKHGISKGLGAGILIGLLVSSCKPAGTSDVQSLDNFSRGSGDLTKNACYGEFYEMTVMPQVELDPALQGNKKLEKELSAAVGLAMSAIPDQFRALLAIFPGSVVRLSGDVSKTCSAKLNPVERLYASEGGRLEACWDANDDRIAIYIEGRPSAVQHHLVRMFARAATEIIASASDGMSAADRASVPAYMRSVDAFRQFEARLTSVFLKEVERRRADGDKVDLSAYSSLINGDAKQRRVFEQFTFAESFDSYYCNSSSGGSRARFKRDFPRTYEAFEAYARNVEADRSFLDRVKPAEKPQVGMASGGFGLLGWNPFSWFWTPASEAMDAAKAGNSARAEYFKTLADPRATDAQIRAAEAKSRQKMMAGLAATGKVAEVGLKAELSVIPGASTGVDLAEGKVGKVILGKAGGHLGGQYGGQIAGELGEKAGSKIGGTVGGKLGSGAQNLVLPGTTQCAPGANLQGACSVSFGVPETVSTSGAPSASVPVSFDVEPISDQPAFDQPAFDQPAFDQPAFDQPAFDQPAFDQPAFDQPAQDLGTNLDAGSASGETLD
jgi:hypothetical protein